MAAGTLDSAEAHYERQARIAALGLLAARRAWSFGLDKVLAVLVGAQLASIQEGEAAVDAMLEEQDIQPGSDYAVNPAMLAGVASDGRDLLGLLELAVTRAQFDRIVETQLADVSRAAESVAIAARPQVQGFVRMVNPGACARCVILAGRWYRWSDGFDRHPNCHCTHVPASEDTGDDLRTDPDAYFHSLGQAEQDRVFTKGGAEAIRLGADMNQVVNARRGMSTAQPVRQSARRVRRVNRRGEELSTSRDRTDYLAQGRLARVDVYGRQLGVTSEGATSRGVGARAMREWDRAGTVRVPGRARGVRRLQTQRLMPESILQVADGRDDAIRMLRMYGYLR